MHVILLNRKWAYYGSQGAAFLEIWRAAWMRYCDVRGVPCEESTYHNFAVDVYVGRSNTSAKKTGFVSS